MTIVQGNQAGLVFRVNDTNHTFYFFHIDSQGNYALDIYGSNGSTTLISSTITTPGQSNVLGVVANGLQISLYVNHYLIDTVTDNTYSQGGIGVAVLDRNNSTEAVFTNAKVWTF